MTTPLQTAIDLLHAVLLPDGDYAYRASETGTWWIVDEHDMADLGDRIGDEESDAYSIWCAATSAREMPRGWEPGAWLVALSDGSSIETKAVIL